MAKEKVARAGTGTESNRRHKPFQGSALPTEIVEDSDIGDKLKLPGYFINFGTTKPKPRSLKTFSCKNSTPNFLSQPCHNAI